MGAMNLGGIDLNLLVALDALLSERSVTRAAQRVGLSQPGMSNALARLRRVFGDPLLVRRGAALVPTARAEALAGPVREALALISGAIDAPAAFDPARDHRSFRVSCSDYSVLMLIGPLVRGLAADAPGRGGRGRPAPPGRGPGAGSRGGRPRHRAAGDHAPRRPAGPPALGRHVDVLRVGRQHPRRRQPGPRHVHRARAPDLLDGRRRPAGRAPRPAPRAPRRAAAHRGERRELPARAVPAAGDRPRHARAGARGGLPAADGRDPDPPAAGRVPARRRDAVVAPAGRGGPRRTHGCASGCGRSRRDSMRGWRFASRRPAIPAGTPSGRRSTSSTTSVLPRWRWRRTPTTSSPPCGTPPSAAWRSRRSSPATARRRWSPWVTTSSC